MMVLTQDFWIIDVIKYSTKLGYPNTQYKLYPFSVISRRFEGGVENAGRQQRKQLWRLRADKHEPQENASNAIPTLLPKCFTKHGG